MEWPHVYFMKIILYIPYKPLLTLQTCSQSFFKYCHIFLLNIDQMSSIDQITRQHSSKLKNPFIPNGINSAVSWPDMQYFVVKYKQIYRIQPSQTFFFHLKFYRYFYFPYDYGIIEGL